MAELVKENENFAWVLTCWGSKTRERKYLCLGGPLDGQRKSGTQIRIESQTLYGRKEGYCAFNRQGSGPETQIFVWFPTHELPK